MNRKSVAPPVPPMPPIAMPDTLTPFRYFCQRVLPAVYGDEISYYELLCKVVNYLNQTMDNVNQMNEGFKELEALVHQLRDYVENYFANLDVQEEINNKLDQMAADGFFDKFFTDYMRVVEIQNDIKTLKMEKGTVRAIGCQTMDDGGGAFFVVESVSKGYSIAMDNGFFANLVPVNGVVNMNAMGVLASNADNKEAVEQAMAAGYSDYFLPEGNYKVKNTVVITRSNFKLHGVKSGPVSEEADTVGSNIVWDGAVSQSDAIMLVSSNGDYTVPSTGSNQVDIQNIGFDGKNLAGYGIFFTYLTNGSYVGDIYAQKCVFAGITVSSGWHFNAGSLQARYNGVGIALGVDKNGTASVATSVNAITFPYLEGHSSVVRQGSYPMTGSGVYIGAGGNIYVGHCVVEQNELYGVTIANQLGCEISALYMEKNGTEGLHLASNTYGTTMIGQVEIGAPNEFIGGGGNVSIGSLSTWETYNPFKEDMINCVNLGWANYYVRQNADFTTWKALIKEYMVFNVLEDWNSSTSNYGNYFTVLTAPAQVSMIITAKTNIENGQPFAISLNGQSFSVPARTWAAGVPYLFPLPAPSKVLPKANSIYNTTTSTNEQHFRLEIVGVKPESQSARVYNVGKYFA